MSHVPVRVNEVLAVFEGRSIDAFFDGTVGAGGHAKAILEKHPEISHYIGCDRDPVALGLAQKNLAPWKKKVKLFHGSHGEIAQWLQEAGVACVDGVLIDAGISSMQLDERERGFSFQGDGPLDMRMNPEADLTAAVIVNRWREEELVRILRDYGEEPRARAIIAARKKKPIRTTKELVEAISGTVKRTKKHLHPATLTFQAIRIAVNDELSSLEKGIEEGMKALCVGGRIVLICFHRLEERIAKMALKNHEEVRALTKKPIEPQEAEVKDNPRSRSARLRAGEKIA